MNETSRRVPIPFEYRGGRVWIRLQVQGQPTWAIFDTGSDGTAIDAEFAAQLGLHGAGRQKGSTVAGEIEMAKAGPVELTLGPRKVSAEEVMLVPLAPQIPGLRAILGFDVLRRVPFTVDFEQRQVHLDSLPSGERFPFVVDGDIRPTTTLETLGQRFDAHLDTGSSRGVSLPLGWVQTNAPELLRDETQREVLGDKVSARDFVLGQVRLGGTDLVRVPGEAVTAGGGSFSAQEGHWANVGNQVLNRFRLGVDGENRTCVFERAGERG